MRSWSKPFSRAVASRRARRPYLGSVIMTDDGPIESTNREAFNRALRAIMADARNA